jgi:hypothetical protein
MISREILICELHDLLWNDVKLRDNKSTRQERKSEDTNSTLWGNSKKGSVSALIDLTDDVGIPERLVTDGATEFTRRKTELD